MNSAGRRHQPPFFATFEATLNRFYRFPTIFNRPFGFAHLEIRETTTQLHDAKITEHIVSTM